MKPTRHLMINIYRSQGDVISMTHPSNSLADLLEKSTETTDFTGEQRVKMILADAKVRLFQAKYHAAVVAKKDTDMSRNCGITHNMWHL